MSHVKYIVNLKESRVTSRFYDEPIPKFYPELHSFVTNINDKVAIISNDRALTVLFINIDDSLSNHDKILETIKRIVKETLRV